MVVCCGTALAGAAGILVDIFDPTLGRLAVTVDGIELIPVICWLFTL